MNRKLYLAPLLLILGMILPGVASSADEPTLKTCRQQIGQREKHLEITPVPEEALIDLLHCNGELAELYNPAIYAEEGVNQSDLKCGWTGVGCKLGSMIKQDVISYTFDENDYYEAVAESFKPGELNRFEDYTKLFPETLGDFTDKKGLEGIVFSAYQKFDENDDHLWGKVEGLDGFDGLKAVVLEVSYHYIRSEMIGFGFDAKNAEDLQVMNSEAQRYHKSLKTCFDQTSVYKGIEHCLAMIDVYASFGSGHFVLEKTLEQNFISEIKPENQGQFFAQVDLNLNVCLTRFFFDPSQKQASFKKMKACLYDSILVGFEEVVKTVVSSSFETNMSQKDLNDVVRLTLDQCEITQIRQGEKLKIYQSLSEVEAEDFEEKLLKCRELIESDLAQRIITDAIISEAILKEFYGDQVTEFSKKISDQYYSQCLDQLKQGGKEHSPQLCEKYLFVATVFEFVDDVLRKEIVDQLTILIGAENLADEPAKLLAEVQLAVSECRADIMNEAFNKPNNKRAYWEKRLTQCLNKGAMRLASRLVEKAVQGELATNPFVDKYNVNLGPNQIRSVAETFAQCVGEKLQGVETLLEFQDTIASSQQSCELDVYKDVLVTVMDQILLAELAGAGLMLDEVESLIQEYKAKPQSLYSSIQEISDKQSLNRLMESADQIILNDIAPDLIERIVAIEAGDYLTPSAFRRVVNLVSKTFLSCTKNDTIAVCQDQAMPLAIEAILYNVLPVEIEREVKAAARHYVPSSTINQLGVRQIIRNSFETPTGRMLIDFIVGEVQKGNRIGAITAPGAFPNTFRELVGQILINHQPFMDSLLNAIIQPRMTQEKNKQKKRSIFHWLGVNLFVNKEIFIWNNVKQMPSGAEVQKRFADILYRLITQPGRPLTAHEMVQIEELVSKASWELNRYLNSRQSKNRREDK